MRRSRSKAATSEKVGAVLYSRVSDPRQVENTSLELQRRECEGLAMRLASPVAAVFEERGESAKSTDRTQLQAALKFCIEHQHELRYFIVFRVDRLSRQAHDYHVLKRMLLQIGIELRVVIGQADDSPEGKLSEGMQALLAQYENDVRIFRTRKGMTENAHLGRWQHLPPLGFLSGERGGLGPSLLHDPQRAPLMRRGFELIDGGATVREALEVVTLEGLRTRSGKDLDLREFRKKLLKPAYMGHIDSFGYVGRGDFDPIVDEALFHRVQVILEGKSKVHGHHVLDDPNLPLRWFVICEWCETPMTGSPTTKKLKDGSKAVHYYYRCRNRKCDGGGDGRINEKKADLEATFADHLRSLSAPEGAAKLFAEILRDTLKKRHREVERARRRFAMRRRALGEERAAITRGYGKGAIDEETTREQLDRNREEDRRLAQKEAELSRPLPDLEQLIPLAERVLADPAGLWEQTWGKQRTALQRFLLPLGVPYDGKAFGTALTAPIFEWLRPPTGAEGKVVTPTGFEPVLQP